MTANCGNEQGGAGAGGPFFGVFAHVAVHFGGLVAYGFEEILLFRQIEPIRRCLRVKQIAFYSFPEQGHKAIIPFHKEKYRDMPP